MKPAIVAVCVIAAAGITAESWQSYQRRETERRVMKLADSSGFIPVEMPDDAPQDAVVVLAPVNCPSAGAKRAESMVLELRARGIPAVRTNQYSARSTGADRAQLDNTMLVLKGTVPIVLINGRGKANPSADEVAIEYHRGDSAAQ